MFVQLVFYFPTKTEIKKYIIRMFVAFMKFRPQLNLLTPGEINTFSINAPNPLLSNFLTSTEIRVASREPIPDKSTEFSGSLKQTPGESHVT